MYKNEKKGEFAYGFKSQLHHLKVELGNIAVDVDVVY